MQSELKPCPFCRAQPTVLVEENTACWYVECDCEAQGPNEATGEQAIAAWNARASDAEITRLTEALRATEEREKGLREALIRAESDLHLIALDSSIRFRLQQDVKRARDNCSTALGSAKPSQEPSHD